MNSRICLIIEENKTIVLHESFSMNSALAEINKCDPDDYVNFLLNNGNKSSVLKKCIIAVEEVNAPYYLSTIRNGF